MLALDDYPSLALFARVVHHRSFSGAAREAGIAKSAVSRRIRELEESLGVRLLQRSTRSVTVTDEGLRVYGHCSALVAAAQAAAEATSEEGPVRGTLRLNAPVTLGQMHVARLVAQFAATYPDVEVHLSTDDRVVDLVEGNFDVVFRVGRLQDSGLIARRLAWDRLVVCGSPGYLEARGVPTSPSDLISHNCLHYGLIDRAAEWRFRGAGVPLPVPTRGSLTATNGTVLREAAVAGLGLAVLPSFMVAREVENGALRLVLEGARRAQIGVYAVTSHRAHLPSRTRRFLEAASRYFHRTEWQLG